MNVLAPPRPGPGDEDDDDDELPIGDPPDDDEGDDWDEDDDDDEEPLQAVGAVRYFCVAASPSPARRGTMAPARSGPVAHRPFLRSPIPDL